MNRTYSAFLVLVFAVAEFLIVGLSLPSERWRASETILALIGSIIAWVVAIGAVWGQLARGSGRASALLQWPLLLLAFCWGLLSVFPIIFAMEMTTKWIIGSHIFAGLFCIGSWAVVQGAGRHVDGVEAKITRTYDNHADLKNAIVHAKTQIASSVLDSPMAQQARMVLDRTDTLPRLILDGPSGVAVVNLVRKVGLAATEGPDKLRGAQLELSEFLVAAKRPR